MTDGSEYLVPRGNTSGRDRKLHTDEDCQAVRAATVVREATDEDVHRYEECALCTGDYDPSGVDHSYHERARAADPDPPGGWDFDPEWSTGRRANPGGGRAVRFRTRSHGRCAGDGGSSGHAGREVIRHHDGNSERHVSVHRLALYAWTAVDLEDLWLVGPEERTGDPRTEKVEAHHDIPIPWLNTEWNLEWKDKDDHSRVEARRKARDRAGRFTGRSGPGREDPPDGACGVGGRGEGGRPPRDPRRR